MALQDFEDVVETFEFLDDWEDRYRHIIDMGKALPAMDDALKVDATKVDGCASQVWLHVTTDGGKVHFQGDSDAMIVKGLIAVLSEMYQNSPLDEARGIDAQAQMARLDLQEHLSSQRSNGLRAMVERLKLVLAA